VQNQYALRVRDWKAESVEVQQRMSFQNLYFWLRDQHARGESHNLYDHTTKKLLKRYKLPFKNMTVPPAPNNLFKYVKGARRLSAWIAECQSSMEELDRPVIMGLPRCPRASSCSSHRSSWLLHPVQRLRRRSDRQCGIERGRRHGPGSVVLCARHRRTATMRS
jgi:hypothetical protein